ncbi:MAG TPA: two-component regulator propeller domain-containing protein, partial [Chitinophagaceae bacterium]|nr:two-component regulator propeller domain-containing protein [Chitinophagaceae bacterium]
MQKLAKASTRTRLFNNNILISPLCFFQLLFFTLLSLSSLAQKTNLKFTHISTKEGLSHANVISILQDKRGFMWFGTRDGLNRYDGYKIKIYKSNPHDSTSLSNNLVQCMFEDSKGNFWIGTQGGGLNRLNRATDRFETFKHSDINAKSIADNSVYSIIEDHEGKIWIATGAGLNLFN